MQKWKKKLVAGAGSDRAWPPSPGTGLRLCRLMGIPVGKGDPRMRIKASQRPFAVILPSLLALIALLSAAGDGVKAPLF